MIVAVPLAPLATMENVREDESMSVATRVPFIEVPAVTVAVPLAATGASFCAVMTRLIVAVLESSAPSFALNLNVSLPVAFAFGV